MTTLKYYTDKAKEFCDGTVNVDMGDLYQPFLELIPDGGKILDAGCGSGRDTKYFKDQGYSVVAFDYSEEIVRLATEYIGEPVLHMSFDDVEFDELKIGADVKMLGHYLGVMTHDKGGPIRIVLFIRCILMNGA